MAAGGDALARLPDGRVVFVEGALPGELVGAELVQEKHDYARATTVDVVEASPDRVEPPCPEARHGCGGCQWQHVTVEAQRRLKREIVIDGLRRIAHLADPPVDPAVPAVPSAGYRTTLRLAVEEGRVAFRRRHSNELLVPSVCVIAHPRLAELLHAGYDGCHEVTLRVSASSGERLVVAAPDARRVRVPVDVVAAGARPRKPGRHPSITEVVAGRRWRISAPSFFQSGPAAATLVAEAVLAHSTRDFPPGGTVVDAYGGIGLLGGLVAERAGAGRVTVIERQRAAAADAVHNLADLPAEAEVVVADVARWKPVRADLVIADPARPGLGRTAAATLAATAAPILVLVSCDPASLARDVTLLAALGYALTGTTVLDLFPHTFHMEAVSRFERRAPAA